MADPFYHKQKRKKPSRLLSADAWLDSSLYDFFTSLGRGYQSWSDFMSRFHVTGVRRLAVEVISDTMTFGMLGLLLLTALALPAFDSTAAGEFNRAADYSVIFLDRYGSEIGRRGIRTDDSVELDKLPDYLINAALATEDRRFYEHFGVDVVGTARALASNVQAGGVVEGGSSITQQLAKNLFLSSERTIERKIKEAFLAVWLETHYSKDEILKLYFDRAYMGGGNFGVAAAAEYYFGKPVQDVTLAEAAMLAGLFKAPTRFAPHIDLAAARARANAVLSNMVEAGFMTEGQVTGARRKPASPIDRSFETESPNYFLDWAFEEIKPILAAHPGAVGFIARTTIDPALQTYAEQAVATVIREEGDAYNVTQAAMVVLEPGGPVRAMVGGLDYGQSQFNRAITPSRQPGSSFKIFDYTAALESGQFTPDTRIADAPICVGNWCPRNYGGSYRGTVTIRDALVRSINTVPVRISTIIGREPIAEMAHRLGIRNDFPITRSLPLGVISVSVIDMASAYAVLANRGRRSTGYGITRITDLRGNAIYDAPDPDPFERPLLAPEIVANMNSMFRDVVLGGTGTRAQIDGVPAAGKTGTTQSYRDAWFCGFTGNYVAAVWYGNDDYSETNRLTGGRLPAQTWQKFMEYAHTNIEVKPLFGIDFEPRAFAVAAAGEAGGDAAAAARPPTLSPEAADRLIAIANDMQRALGALGVQAAIDGAPAPGEPVPADAVFPSFVRVGQ
ncbi:MAG TPA: PBP1A family penicillin-binding protein [Devosiaceae bacterium]|nr:PBP1A family penicillin-binding protein [Devosiaceae bacterium]